MPRPTTRRAYHHGRLPEALIEAAIACIEQAGMHGLTIREVARRADVSHQAPYHYFADRGALVAAVAETGFRSLYERLKARIAKVGENDRMEALFMAYVKFAIEKTTLFRVMFSTEVADKTPYPSLQASSDQCLTLLMDTVTSAQHSGAVRDGPTLDYAAVTWALAHGLSGFLTDGQLRRRGYTASAAEVVAKRLLAVLRDGLTPHS